MFEYPDGATPIDEDEKEGLLIPHISTLEELNVWGREILRMHTAG